MRLCSSTCVIVHMWLRNPVVNLGPAHGIWWLAPKKALYRGGSSSGAWPTWSEVKAAEGGDACGNRTDSERSSGDGVKADAMVAA